MLIWRCKKCGWIGRDSDLGLHYGNDEEYCPRCKEVDSMQQLIFLTASTARKLKSCGSFLEKSPLMMKMLFWKSSWDFRKERTE